MRKEKNKRGKALGNVRCNSEKKVKRSKWTRMEMKMKDEDDDAS